MDKITTYVLLFGTIAHIQLKTDPEAMAIPALIWVTMFILDFMSTWFRVYSIYLAGPRTDKVSSAIETVILAPYRGNTLTGIFVDNVADLWIAAHCCLHVTNVPLQKLVDEVYFKLFMQAAFIVAMYRLAVLVIELKQGFMRIIDLDCDDYNKKLVK